MNPEHQVIWDEVQANHRKRELCTGHEFLPPRDERKLPLRKVTCKNCGAWADITDAIWYEEGRRHMEAKVAALELEAEGLKKFEAEVIDETARFNRGWERRAEPYRLLEDESEQMGWA